MRVTDARYMEHRQMLGLALRMLRLGARTCTIRTCTGLSDDRILRLYHAYCTHDKSTPAYRKRGKTPQHIDCFMGSRRTQMEASVLSSIFLSLGLVRPNSRTRWQPSPATAAALCDAYDLYQLVVDRRELTFEHSWSLLRAVTEGTTLQLIPCPRCAGVMVHDRFDLVPVMCATCRTKKIPAPRKQTQRLHERNC